MSSDLFVFDSTFFAAPFSPFNESSIDILPSIPISDIYEETSSVDQIAGGTLVSSSSPPSHQLQNLSLSQTVRLGIPSNGLLDYSVLEVKTEECQIPFYSNSTHDYNNNNNDSNYFLPHSYGGGCETDSAVKMMQRSFSSNCFDGKPNFLFQPRFDSPIMESPNIHHSTTPQVQSSPENCFSSAQMRRVCSTGDLQSIKTTQTRLSSSPLGTESSLMEEANSKVGRYSAEERKERIHRYRAKRAQRNFNKTIKYACRKTLADNRPRIRGRFARNDEPGETPKASTFNQYEDDDELWGYGYGYFQDEAEEGRRVALFKSSCYGTSHQFQYCGYS